MTTNFIASLSVSAIALTVIFLVLTILICVIKILDRLLPYQEPPAPPPKAAPMPPAGEMDEHIAAITAALSTHLGAAPDSFRIESIKSAG